MKSETQSGINRRNILKIGFGTAGAVLFSSNLTKAFAAACGLTPPQTPGPFFPGEEKFDNNNDLTQVRGGNGRPEGQLIYIQGQVLNEKCLPIPSAQVELWQACASGHYNNPTDTNPAPLDPNFGYWGEAITDANGRFSFKTIIPGAYPADTDWVRPPHLHFKVSCRGYHELITQMYFQGDPLNDTDLILKKIPRQERSRVVVKFDSAPPPYEMGSKIGTFDLTLQSVR